MIQVTRPFLPPLEEYKKYTDLIFDNNWLTNMGPLSKDLEKQLADYLAVDELLFVTNGTVALQLAIKALGLTGEIITTPFSFIATSSTIIWEGCQPVFADIDPKTLNIDPLKIKEKIGPNTCAILATHVYGNPCDVEVIEKIAEEHNLKVIYDGAHAFSVEINNRSVFDFGDVSTCSLHATKLYHSVEGGLVFTPDATVFRKIKLMRNFGFHGPEAFDEIGINGKNSEFHAAMGLANLKYITSIIAQRKLLTERYYEKLEQLPLTYPEWHPAATKNYAYFPVIFDSEEALTTCMQALVAQDIHPRRYFYPSLSSVLPGVTPVSMPITDDIAPRVLCLPLYTDLKVEEIDLICSIIRTSLQV